jgi:hypothetical protein
MGSTNLLITRGYGLAGVLAREILRLFSAIAMQLGLFSPTSSSLSMTSSINLETDEE